jgi:hypothetical protein
MFPIEMIPLWGIPHFQKHPNYHIKLIISIYVYVYSIDSTFYIAGWIELRPRYPAPILEWTAKAKHGNGDDACQVNCVAMCCNQCRATCHFVENAAFIILHFFIILYKKNTKRPRKSFMGLLLVFYLRGIEFGQFGHSKTGYRNHPKKIVAIPQHPIVGPSYWGFLGWDSRSTMFHHCSIIVPLMLLRSSSSSWSSSSSSKAVYGNPHRSTSLFFS